MPSLLLTLCSALWILALIPAAGALIATIMTAAPATQHGNKRAGWLIFGAHIAFFPLVIACVIGAWVAQVGGAAWGIVLLILLLPLTSVGAFAYGLIRMK